MTQKAIAAGVPQEVVPYLSMPYTRTIVPDEDGFVAEVLELPGCISEGDTPEEAYRNLEDAMAGYIAIELEDGHTIPEPLGNNEYSGRVLLRFSSSLHRGAAVRAMHEGVSLNQWLGQAAAEKLNGANLVEAIVARLAAGTGRFTAGFIQFESASNGAARETTPDVLEFGKVDRFSLLNPDPKNLRVLTEKEHGDLHKRSSS